MAASRSEVSLNASLSPQFRQLQRHQDKDMTSLSKVFARLSQSLVTLAKVDQRIDEIKINQGIILSKLNQNKTSNCLKDYEFKVFSQWGEDGILQHLTECIPIKNKTFIEFGIENFLESNCRFLLMKDDWKGFVIDGSAKNIANLRQSYFYWKHHLKAVDAFITKDNINELLAQSGFEDDLGILSIDLDGNDYYILQAITTVKPRILVCEFNPLFGDKRKVSVPYQSDFRRTKAHYTNLYWGASLAAMTYLADKKGYALVGTNTAGNNAFYVRKDLINKRIDVLSVEEAYLPSNFRESIDKKGNLTHLSGDERLDIIKGLPVFEVETQALEVL